jgi:osmotically-inducible protein OsmY
MTSWLSKPKHSTLHCLLAACLALPLLNGCFFGAVTAITAGSLAAADRRTVGIQVEDRTIGLKTSSAIRERFGDAVNINVEVYNRQVLLTGEAPDEATRSSIETTAAGMQNVRLLVNDIQIGPKSSLSARSNDAFITTRVKASFVDAQDIFANAFKVSTEAGVVYIMGIVTERESNRAARVAAGVPGVIKVVKVTETISEDDLSRLTTTPNTTPNPKVAPGR